MQNICIIGGGFGGVEAAFELNRQSLHDVRIQLISDKPHFEYHARLYRVLTGRSPLEVCVPLGEVFNNTFVEVIYDKIQSFDLANKTFTGSTGKVYNYDQLVLGLGSEPDYFDTPGLKELSYSISSIKSVLDLKRHLHEIFLSCSRASKEDKNCSAHIIVVGGGATGVESAGELAIYARRMARKHGVDPSFVTLDLIHSGSRLLPSFPEDISEKIRERLQSLGVNIFFNRRVLKEELEQVYMKDIEMKSKTLIWCAGVRPSKIISQISGLTLDDKGRVIVNENLQAQGYENVYVVGDCAATKYAGMAQSALQDGDYVAQRIAAKLKKVAIRPYVQKEPVYAVPVGPGWAAYVSRALKFTGTYGWWMRRYLDFRFFLTMLSPAKAYKAYANDRIMWESCPVCCADKSC